MNFRPLTDWRNWVRNTRAATTERATEIRVGEDITEGNVRLTFMPLTANHLQTILTPTEAFALGSELMRSAVATRAAGDCLAPAPIRAVAANEA